MVQERLESNHYGKHSTTTKFLLEDKMFCGYCGNKMIPASGSGNGRVMQRYYRCSGRVKLKKCHKVHIRKDLIEEIIVETVFKTFENLAIFSSEISLFYQLYIFFKHINLCIISTLLKD